MERKTFMSRMVDRFVQDAIGLGCMVLVVGATGCSDLESPGSGGGRMTGWSQTVLPDTPRDAAFDAGVYAMRQWFHLAETVPEEGLVRGATEEYQQEGGTGRIRDDAVGYRNRMRRTAALVIGERETGCVAKCRVRVQRLDTADHRVFRRNEQFGDVPNETPIDRGAAVSTRQDQVWTDMPRDRALERQILNLLQSRTSGEASG